MITPEILQKAKQKIRSSEASDEIIREALELVDSSEAIDGILNCDKTKALTLARSALQHAENKRNVKIIGTSSIAEARRCLDALAKFKNSTYCLRGNGPEHGVIYSYKESVCLVYTTPTLWVSKRLVKNDSKSCLSEKG